MRHVLTDRYLKSLKPAPTGKRATVWDATVPSFGVRITDRGVKTFIVWRRRAGHSRPTRIAIGTYPGTSLAAARRKAGEALKVLAEGDHPREREAAANAAKARQQANSFAAVAEKFMKQHVSKLRTAGDVEKAIRRELIPRWGKRAITDIRRTDVLRMVEEVTDASGPYMARNMLAYTRKLWNWVLARDYGVEASPCDRVKATELVGSPKARQRTLTDAELRTLWRATDANDYPLDSFIRLLVITGARRSEVAQMRREDIDLVAAIWRLTGDQTKNEDPRIVPLPALAVDLLRGLPEWKGPYILSTTSGKRPISGFAKLKSRLDRRVAATAAGIRAWRLHDLRRTMRTGLSTLGVPPFIGELALGHRQRGVHAVYDLHRYDAEIRDAMERWAKRLQSIVQPPPANVVQLAAKSRGGA